VIISSDSEHDNKNIADVGDWTGTKGARNMEQFLGAKGLTNVHNNPERIPEAADQFLGNELFHLFVDQSNLYH
jgi:hypothetical protein